jgi:hypothetical protein
MNAALCRITRCATTSPPGARMKRPWSFVGLSARDRLFDLVGDPLAWIGEVVHFGEPLEGSG